MTGWIVAVFGAFLFGIGVGGALDLSKTAAERRARRKFVNALRLAKDALTCGAITFNQYQRRHREAEIEYHQALLGYEGGDR